MGHMAATVIRLKNVMFGILKLNIIFQMINIQRIAMVQIYPAITPSVDSQTLCTTDQELTMVNTTNSIQMFFMNLEKLMEFSSFQASSFHGD